MKKLVCLLFALIIPLTFSIPAHAGCTVTTGESIEEVYDSFGSPWNSHWVHTLDNWVLYDTATNYVGFQAEESKTYHITIDQSCMYGDISRYPTNGSVAVRLTDSEGNDLLWSTGLSAWSHSAEYDIDLQQGEQVLIKFYNLIVNSTVTNQYGYNPGHGISRVYIE